MSSVLSVTIALTPVISLGAFGFAYWYFFVHTKRVLGKVAKR